MFLAYNLILSGPALFINAAIFIKEMVMEFYQVNDDTLRHDNISLRFYLFGDLFMDWNLINPFCWLGMMPSWATGRDGQCFIWE